MEKITQKLLLFLVCLFSTTIFAIIIKHDSIVSIFQYIDVQKNNNIFILFDVDHTLIEPVGSLGSGPWCSLVFKSALKQKNNESYAREKESEMRGLIAPYLIYQPVEVITPDVIQQLQKYGFILLGLTARDHLLAYWTYKELSHCNIDFRSLFLSSNTNNDREKYNLKYGIIFRKEGYDKGSMLVDMLVDYMLAPTLILCVDDTLQNLEDIQNRLKIAMPEVEFVGIHYCPISENKVIDIGNMKNEIEALPIDSLLKQELMDLLSL